MGQVHPNPLTCASCGASEIQLVKIAEGSSVGNYYCCRCNTITHAADSKQWTIADLVAEYYSNKNVRGALSIYALAREFVEELRVIQGSTKSEAAKRDAIVGTAEAYVFLIEQSLVMHKMESECCDDPALDSENSFCDCGRMTDNYPVICDHCRYMSSMD